MTIPQPLPDRRTILQVLAATAVAIAVPGYTVATASPAAADESQPTWTTQTLESFADTLIPGERRYSGDYAIAGAVVGPGAVVAGAMDVLNDPRLPLSPLLPSIAALLDARAAAYAVEHLILLPLDRPSFTGLSFTHRTRLVTGLFDDDEVDLPVWQMLSFLVCLAFDTAGYLPTRDAIAAGHPGLAWIGFPAPSSNGQWAFPQHSYGRPLADLHPSTTASGSPA